MRLQVELLVDDNALECETLEFNDLTGDLEATISLKVLKNFMQSRAGSYQKFDEGGIMLGCSMISLASGMSYIVGKHRIGLLVGEIRMKLYPVANIVADYVDIAENWSMSAAKPIKIRISTVED